MPTAQTARSKHAWGHLSSANGHLNSAYFLVARGLCGGSRTSFDGVDTAPWHGPCHHNLGSDTCFLFSLPLSLQAKTVIGISCYRHSKQIPLTCWIPCDNSYAPVTAMFKHHCLFAVCFEIGHWKDIAWMRLVAERRDSDARDQCSRKKSQFMNWLPWFESEWQNLLDCN